MPVLGDGNLPEQARVAVDNVREIFVDTFGNVGNSD